MMPSSDAVGFSSMPYRSNSRLPTISARRRVPAGRRGVQDDPPVAEFVAEPFDQQRGVRGHRAGGGALVVEQRHRFSVANSSKPIAHGNASKASRSSPASAPVKATDGRAEFGGTSAVAAPERQPRRLARRRDDQHAVVGDLGDPPAGGAQ
jgi:hypothetical protein